VGSGEGGGEGTSLIFPIRHVNKTEGNCVIDYVVKSATAKKLVVTFWEI
jgi:hypothetical protein